MSKTGETVTFEYNEDGLRTKKIATSTGTTEYTLHGKNIVHMKKGNDEMHFFYEADNKPVIVVNNGVSYRYMYTLQGDVFGLVDESNNFVVWYRYDAWGKPLGVGGSLGNTLGRMQPFRYRGYVFDEETGLYYLRSRYYRPGWGRFVSADVIINMDVFAYCCNNPVSRVDENGLSYNNASSKSVFSLRIDDRGNYTATQLLSRSSPQPTISYPDSFAGLPRNPDGIYSLYDNGRFRDNNAFHEQFIVLTPVFEAGVPSIIRVGGEFDFATAGWEIDIAENIGLDLSLFDFVHGEATFIIDAQQAGISLLASAWSPSASISFGEIDIGFGAEIGSIGIEIGIGSDGIEFKVAYGTGFSFGITW